MEKRLIGKQIQKAREKSGLSQEQLAERIGLSSSAISMIERGARAPSLESFVKILNALEASADVVLMDVLRNGYKTKASKIAELIEALSLQEQQKVFAVLDAMVLS